MDESEFDELMRHQNIMMRSVANESETDSKISMMDIVNDLVTDRNLISSYTRGRNQFKPNRR